MHDESVTAGPAPEIAARLLAIFTNGVEQSALLMPLNAFDQIDAIAEHLMPQLV
jgi:hypothetical protein